MSVKVEELLARSLGDVNFQERQKVCSRRGGFEGLSPPLQAVQQLPFTSGSPAAPEERLRVLPAMMS